MMDLVGDIRCLYLIALGLLALDTGTFTQVVYLVIFIGVLVHARLAQKKVLRESPSRQ